MVKIIRTLSLLVIATALITSLAGAQTNTDGYAYTFQNATGNRYVDNATGVFPNVRPAGVQFQALPIWVVGGLVNDAPIWTVALDNGEVYAVQTTNDIAAISGLLLEVGTVEPGQPITAFYDGENLPVLLTAGDDLSPLSAPVVINPVDRTLVYVATNGDLVLWRDGTELARQPLNIQLDGVPVVTLGGTVAVYTQATADRYVHGIMGDDLEGAALAIVGTADDTLTLTAQVDLPGEDVFEGLSPLWADVDDDGEDEIVTTVSNGSAGAWVRAYEQNGDVLAESTAIGQGFRWRHQLAVAPFGIEGETQIVDVRTPHIGGMVEFFTLTGAALEVNNAQLGYTSHVIGSRNLDQGLAGDFNGNGTPELVVTDQAQQNVVGLENSLQGVAEVWRLPLTESGNTLSTNFAAVRRPDGTLALAAGANNNVLRVWR